MDSLNKMGMRMVIITLVAALIAFGAWKGIGFGISTLQKRSTPTPSVTQSLPPVTSVSPPPALQGEARQDERLSPELQQQLSGFVATTEKALGQYTKQYVESLPKDAQQEQVLDSKNLLAFIDSHKGTLLPELPKNTVQITTKTGKDAITKYLDAISPAQNPAIATITWDAVTAALNKQQTKEDLESLAPVRALVEKNYLLFGDILVPQEAVGLHTKLLQATQSMITNLKLLQEMRNDIVGGLIGQRNISDLDVVFSDIESQISALEKKYEIK